MTKLRSYLGAEGEAGQALLMIAIVFMGLLFVVGLAVDTGQLFAAKRTQQEAADAAAFAGAVVIYQHGTVTQAVQAAIADATKNGFTDGVNTTTVTVNGCTSYVGCTSAPTSGAYAGESPVRHVEVVIVHQVKTTLVPAEAAFNPVRARGVAGAEPFNNQYAIMVLSPTCAGSTTPTFTASSNVDLHVTGSGVFVNASCGTAVSGFTGTDFTVAAPYSLDIVGSSSDTFPAGVNQVNRGVTAQPDPFAGYPIPDGKSYNTTSNLPTDPARIAGTTTAVEGIYTTSLGNVAVCHGIYILKGAGMSGDVTRDTTHTDPNTGTACDGRVFIYNTMTNWPAATGTCSSLGQNGNHPITMLPMTTGTYANMQIYQDKACAATFLVGVGSVVSTGGTIYLPSGPMSLNGNVTSITAGQIVVKTMDLQNANLDVMFTPATTASPVLPRLAE
ncbi:MAG: pilus assembly protein TadG-related protein [Chloroflexota bacterium]|nr:pilus assembly protein TadG-related protein [Chloroflexota bacterium]